MFGLGVVCVGCCDVVVLWCVIFLGWFVLVGW